MNQIDTCDFSRGVGLPYHAVCHLLRGSKKSPKQLAEGDDCYFLDENLRGYGGWGTDDPDLAEINEMEISIGKLTPEVLDLRTMVDFCCIWRYDYPRRVLEICRAIGGKGHTVGRCHYQVGTDKRDELISYACALKKWLGENVSADEVLLPDKREAEIVEQRVNSMLGEQLEIKKLLVERTLIGLASRHIDCSFFGSRGDGKPERVFPAYALELKGDWRFRMKELERKIIKEMGGGAYDFLCEVGGSEPPCHFKFIRRLEILIGSIGCLKWRGFLPPKDEKVSGRRELTQQYLSVLRDYWAEGSGGEVNRNTSLTSLKKELFEALGDSQPFKRWLIASLWKNIKNQTQYQAFTMKHWVEFVQIVRSRMASA